MKTYNTYENCETATIACSAGDKKKIITRLTVVGLTVLLGLVLSVCTLFSDGFSSAYAAFGTTLCIAPLFWGFAKWWGFMWPRSKRLATKFWNLTIPLTLIALAIKVMVWIWMAMIPVMLYFVVLAPVIGLLQVLASLPCQWLMEFLFLLLCGAVLVFMLLIDISKLRGLCWKEVLRAKLCKT